MSRDLEFSEHDYLKELVLDRYLTAVILEIDPLRDEIRSLLHQGKVSEAIALERQAQNHQRALLDERIRSEEIITWLYWDTRIRAEGDGTYPDIYEGGINAL